MSSSGKRVTITSLEVRSSTQLTNECEVYAMIGGARERVATSRVRCLDGKACMVADVSSVGVVLPDGDDLRRVLHAQSLQARLGGRLVRRALRRARQGVYWRLDAVHDDARAKDLVVDLRLVVRQAVAPTFAVDVVFVLLLL